MRHPVKEEEHFSNLILRSEQRILGWAAEPVISLCIEIEDVKIANEGTNGGRAGEWCINEAPKRD